ncbi:hypothetical protein LWI28_014554 [Acer negundo]|uniref:Uncharacterized protein n=1 Tax=Acer negundo TaxID=4023 RepID=A0AAD5NQ47_ACENE|nr:hypothetical protein LWI28_014554 [Acer negundo]
MTRKPTPPYVHQATSSTRDMALSSRPCRVLPQGEEQGQTNSTGRREYDTLHADLEKRVVKITVESTASARLGIREREEERLERGHVAGEEWIEKREIFRGDGNGDGETAGEVKEWDYVA